MQDGLVADLAFAAFAMAGGKIAVGRQPHF